MSSEFGKVAVIFGGTSAEREVSLKSGTNVLDGLLSAGVDAFAFDTKDQPLSALVQMNVDRVFIVLHGRGGEDGSIQGALQFLGIPYTGSGVLGSALAMDKVRCKQLFKASDLPTPAFMVLNKADYQQGNEAQMLEKLGGVVFVKPANEGSSIGMNRAETPEQLLASIENAFDYDQRVLLESFVNGPEYTVTILAGQALPVIELKTPRTFYDYTAKYQSSTTQYLCPCDLSAEKTTQIQQLSKAAFEVVGANGWGRVDVMLGQDDKFYLLEVNTVPGMTAKSLVPMAAKAAGYELPELLLEILKTSLPNRA